MYEGSYYRTLELLNNPEFLDETNQRKYIIMATNSFQTTLTFNKKTIDSLLQALENNSEVHLEDISNVRIVKESKEMEDIFKKYYINDDCQETQYTHKKARISTLQWQ